MTDKNIQEAEVGSGTKVADTKQSEKRAQLTLKSIQLRLKQEKERAALQQQKKSLRVKEDIEESFSPSQIAALKAEYSKINTVDPDSDTYKKLIAMLDRLDLKSLKSLAGAEIKFVSKLAQNRVLRKSMKKEEVQLDEVASFRVDSLVTDALKIMKGSDLKDAVQALKTVLGDREYNDRRGHYNFYVKQLVDMYGKKANEELDIELDEVLSKDATAGDFIHDFVNSDNPKFAGKSKEKRKQMALAAYYAKQKNEELSPKQKAIDKNKNGKIDGFDLSHLRKKTEELSPKQKALDKNKNGKIDGSDLAKLRKEEVDLQEKSDYEVYHKDYSTAVQTAIKQAEKRGYEVDMDDWHDKVATGPKKPSSGKTNSFSINLMKDGKPSKKKLQMQVYNMDNHKYELNMYIEEIQLEEMTDGDKSSIALQAMVARKKLQQTAGKNKSQSFIDKMTSKANAGDRLPKKPADEYDRKVVKYLKKKHGMSEASVEETYEGVVDKIKAIKRGMQAKAKADDHFDKAGDPKNANASKDLKKAVRYNNLLNKEETEIVTEARKKSFKDVKKKMKEEEVPNKSTIKKGDMLTGKREPIEINPELKEPAR